MDKNEALAQLAIISNKLEEIRSLIASDQSDEEDWKTKPTHYITELVPVRETSSSSSIAFKYIYNYNLYI